MEEVGPAGEEWEADLFESEAADASLLQTPPVPPACDVQPIARVQCPWQRLCESANEGADPTRRLMSGKKDPHDERGILTTAAAK